MALVVGDSIRRLEFGGPIDTADRAVLLRAARVELATNVKGRGLPKGTRLLKAYATSPRGAKRIVFLLEVAKGDLFLLFYRDKKDAVGANVTIRNKTFKEQLLKRLDLLAKDLEAGNFECVRA